MAPSSKAHITRGIQSWHGATFWIRSSVTGPVLACIPGMPSPWPTGDVKEVEESLGRERVKDGTFDDLQL